MSRYVQDPSLKTCPFCGGLASRQVRSFQQGVNRIFGVSMTSGDVDGKRSGKIYWVGCVNPASGCFQPMVYGMTLDQAKEKWNRRV